MSIGGTIKGRFALQGGTQLRPGVILAYQLTTVDEVEDITGLNVGFTFEAAFPLKDHRAIVAELGFTTQPGGGNEDVDVTWGPIFYLTVGYLDKGVFTIIGIRFSGHFNTRILYAIVKCKSIPKNGR